MRDVLAKFSDAKRDGDGWAAKCPAHDDRRASLSIGTGADGRALLCCHAGCTLDAILAAVNLEPRDLFPEHAIATKATIIATYPYHDEGGAHLFDVVRFAPKDFRQRRADGVWTMAGVRRVLYRLPELQGQSIAYLAEGEKDADRLRAIGLSATTNAGGAGKWRDDYTAQLTAAGVQAVAILPDNDEPGRAHAEAAARACDAGGLRVKIVTLPDLPPKGDVSNWFDRGRTRADLVALVKKTALYAPAPAPVLATTPPGEPAGLALIALSDLLTEPEEPIAYVVEDRIAAGSVNILAGKPKAGKSTLARAVAFEVSRGGSILDRRCQPGTVWYLALEDKRSEVRRHFRQMGANGTEPVRFLFQQSAENLIASLHALAAAEAPALIIVDTVQRLIKARDLNDYAEVTTKLTPILALARGTDAAVLLVHHAGKGERAGIDAPLGSTALTGSVDNVFLLSRTERYRVLSSIQRIGSDLPETVITLDPETGGVEAGPSRHDADRATIGNAIVAALTHAGEPLTEALLEPAVEGRTSLKREALRALVHVGRVSRDGRGGKGDPFRYTIPVPEAGNNQTETGHSAPAGGSCSLVPSYSREQQNTNRVFGETLGKHGLDACSRVPGRGQHDTGGREHASDDEDAWLDL